MQAIPALAAVLISLFAATLQGCSDHNQDRVSAPAGSNQDLISRPPENMTFFTCTACLVDDSARCATNRPVCGDSTERTDSEVGAKDALCDTLTPAELARRPTPEGFKPSPYLKNACYSWPADAFKTSCTTFTATCERVPIH